MKNLSNLQKSWKKVGFRFSCSESKTQIDIEQLIVNTASAGRDEPVLIWALLTWIIQYADLINTHRLIRMLNSETDSIIGALCEIALEKGADAKLNYIIGNCKPKDKPEILFNIMKQTKVASNNEKDNPLDVFNKWGLYCSTITIKDDALFNRQYILRNNNNLAIRAVFGANTKSEILSLLTSIPKAYISQMAREINLSYQPVYAEVENLLRNKIIECEQIGRIKLVSLTKKTLRFLKALPVL